MKVFSFFRPLNPGAEFTGKVRFHNLRKAEIGALLSAITFHGNNNKLFHSIGGAKPYGYGKIKVTVKNFKGLEHSFEDYLSTFENLMEAHCPDWINNSSLQELFAMSAHASDEETLTYPKLKLEGVPAREANEFINYKKEGASLKNYSESNGVPKVSSITARLEIEEKIKGGAFEIDRESLKNIKQQLREQGIVEIPDELKGQLEDALRHVFENHNDSQRKLSKKPFQKEYEWHTTITHWLGEKRAKGLYKELTGNDPDKIS